MKAACNTADRIGRNWKAAEHYGCDMELLRAAIGRTPAERIRYHTHALATANILRRAVRARDERS